MARLPPPPSTGRGMISMEEFRGDPEQFERLRDRLRALHAAKTIKSAELERLAKTEAKALGTAFMTRTDIDKFREGTVTRPREIQKVLPLWNVVFSEKFLLPGAPAIAGDAPAHEHDFFHSSVRFFDVHQHRSTRVGIDLPGRFVFYHFSEYFHKFSDAVQRAVVVGQWDIALTGGAYCIEEQQGYDGNLGKHRMIDHYNGYCLPKGPNICLMMKEVKKETPKFYMLETVYDHPKTLKTEVMAGYMLKGSYKHKFFHSPVYAVRVDDDKDVECNILRCGDISGDVLHELDALSDR
jgi:hypothetical protein